MYLFLQDAESLVKELGSRFGKMHGYFTQNGLYRKWQKAYDAYYNNQYKVTDSGVVQLGEQGEFAGMSVNHTRNIIKHIYTMTVQNKIVFDSLASNSDIESRNAVKVANAVLEYYFYHQNFEEYLKATLEMSLVFGTAHLGVVWEPNKTLVGKDEMEMPVYKGTPKFQAFSPYDVLLEPYRDDPRSQPYMATRELVCKWDLIALYPELSEKIESLPKVKDLQRFMPWYMVDNDTCWLYRAYHKPTPALPNGRYTQFCDDGLVLSDTDKNPYGGIPIITCTPDRRFGGAFGHSIAFDLAPLQDSVNFLHSTILSNQQAFGTQNIAVPKEADIEDDDLNGGLKLLKFKSIPEVHNGGAPFALELCKTPAEVFSYQNVCVQAMEMISGVNSATRGQPGSSLTSGTAIALVSSAAQSFNSTVESAYVGMAEEAATMLVTLVKQYVKEEEIIAISGKSDSYAVESFVGSQLEPVKQVKIQVGNPLSKTLAGKLEIANQMLKGGLIKNTDQYLEILETGDVSHVVDEETSQETLIRSENDLMLTGKPPQMLWCDNHIRHIQSHKTLVDRLDVRLNPGVRDVILKHVQEHMDQLDDMSQLNPIGLAVALGQPLPLPSPGSNPIQGALTPPTGSGPTAPPPPGASPLGPGGTPPPPPTGGVSGPVHASQSATSALQNGAAGPAASAEKRAAKQVELAKMG